MSIHCYLIETFVLLFKLGVWQTVVPLVPRPAHPIGLPCHVQMVIAGGLRHHHALRGGGVTFAGHGLLAVMDQFPATE